MPLETLAAIHPDICTFARDGEEGDQDSRGWVGEGRFEYIYGLRGIGRVEALENTKREEGIERKSPGADERFAPALKRKNLFGRRRGWEPNSISLLETRKKMIGNEIFLGRMEDICVRWPQFSQ